MCENTQIFCFFEQSGTFKNEFKKLGFKNAYDCDILNDFDETDYLIDLFLEIEKAHKGVSNTIFDKMNAGDLIFAFFPCIKFTEKAFMYINCSAIQWINSDNDFKLSRSVEKIKESVYFYELLCKLCQICIRRKIKLVVENPLTGIHFLSIFFPLKSQIKLKNRAEWGDYFKKPTQFWFVGFEPSYNFIFENIENKGRSINMGSKNEKELLEWFKEKYNLEIKSVQKARSMISPTFANRFIREFIL